MAARHGTISPTLCAGVPFLGGLRRGGGGWRLLCAPTHARGGRRWEHRPAWPKKPGGIPWACGPLSRKNLGFAGGDTAIWYCMVWYGMVWYGMVWYGMVWYGMVWYGMVWYVVVVVVVVVAPSTCRREKLPDTLAWAGRKGAVGRRHAGRACADNDRGGGGGFRLLSGGQGARVAVRGITCPCDRGSLPRGGGRVCAPMRNGGRTGGGTEGPPVRGPTGPRFPLLPAATPPRQGRGLRPVRR